MLMQPPIAKATRYKRETPPQGIASGNRAETTAEGQSLQQKGEPHTSRAEPRQATSEAVTHKESPNPPPDRASEKKRGFLTSYVAAELNITA